MELNHEHDFISLLICKSIIGTITTDEQQVLDEWRRRNDYNESVYQRLTDLNRLCETYYDHIDTPRHAAKVFEQVRQTIESIKSDEGRIAELEDLVDNCRGGLMSKLRSQCPKLNERELKVALYSYAGFSSRAICIFIESNPVALSKIKYRIKTKIKECGGADAEMLLSAMVDS